MRPGRGGLLWRPDARTDALRVSLCSMMRRHARTSGCGEIRDQLADLCGGVLRRGRLRRHIERCAGRRRFAAEVCRQHAELAVLLPVEPSPGLKHSILSGAAATGGSYAASADGSYAASAGGSYAASASGSGAASADGSYAASAGSSYAASASGSDAAAAGDAATIAGHRVAFASGDGAATYAEAAAGMQMVTARVLLALGLAGGGLGWRRWRRSRARRRSDRRTCRP